MVSVNVKLLETFEKVSVDHSHFKKVSSTSVCGFLKRPKWLRKQLPVRGLDEFSLLPFCRGTQCNVGQYQPTVQYTLCLVQLQGCWQNNEPFPVHNSSFGSALSSSWTFISLWGFSSLCANNEQRERVASDMGSVDYAISHVSVNPWWRLLLL